MFINLIKAWLKRPVVINFNVETMPDDAKVCVLTTNNILPRELIEDIQDQLNEWRGEVKLVVISNSKPLQTLSDTDLKAIGLIRTDFGDDNEQTINFKACSSP